MTSHDYVVVGAGSAGCGLAARLSEQPDVSVRHSWGADPHPLSRAFIDAYLEEADLIRGRPIPAPAPPAAVAAHGDRAA
jgi:flavin-dependent dehydrogenase